MLAALMALSLIGLATLGYAAPREPIEAPAVPGPIFPRASASGTVLLTPNTPIQAFDLELDIAAADLTPSWPSLDGPQQQATWFVHVSATGEPEPDAEIRVVTPDGTGGFVNNPESFFLAGGPKHSHGDGKEHSHYGVAFTTWLDPRQAIRQADSIRAALAERRPQHAQEFDERCVD